MIVLALSGIAISVLAISGLTISSLAISRLHQWQWQWLVALMGGVVKKLFIYFFVPNELKSPKTTNFFHIWFFFNPSLMQLADCEPIPHKKFNCLTRWLILGNWAHPEIAN